MVVKKIKNDFPVGSTTMPLGSLSGLVKEPLSLPIATVHSPCPNWMSYGSLWTLMSGKALIQSSMSALCGGSPTVVGEPM